MPFPQKADIGLAGLMTWKLYTYLNKPSPIVPTDQGPWRPPEWKNLPSNMEQLVYLRANIAQKIEGTDYFPASTLGYFFDAIIREDHASTLRITEHPVQTGANIVDHAYQIPAHLTLEIGMSDAMDSLVLGQWSSEPSTYISGKSVSAYKKLKELQKSRLPLIVQTRLERYENMLIENISSPVDNSTVFGLKATITFRQIITAMVREEKVSIRPQISKETPLGTQQPTAPTASIIKSHDMWSIPKSSLPDGWGAGPMSPILPGGAGAGLMTPIPAWTSSIPPNWSGGW